MGANKYMQPTLGRKQIMVNNFIGGLFWALGSILGLAVIAGIIGLVLNFVDLKLILGEWLGGVIRESLSTINNVKN